MLLLLSWIMVGYISILRHILKKEKEKKRDDTCYEFISFYHSVL
jgi:hypothetical protein